MNIQCGFFVATLFGNMKLDCFVSCNKLLLSQDFISFYFQFLVVNVPLPEHSGLYPVIVSVRH